jgi:hypothetical protein
MRMLLDVGERETPDYRRERQESFRPKRIDMLSIWKVFCPVITAGS